LAIEGVTTTIVAQSKQQAALAAWTLRNLNVHPLRTNIMLNDEAARDRPRLIE